MIRFNKVIVFIIVECLTVSLWGCQRSISTVEILESPKEVYNLEEGEVNCSIRVTFTSGEKNDYDLDSAKGAGFVVAGQYFDTTGWNFLKIIHNEYRVSLSFQYYVKVDVRETYVVTLDPDGGEPSQYVIASFNELLPGASAPVKEGYHFLGFYIGDVMYYDREMNPTRVWSVKSAGTLTAKWGIMGDANLFDLEFDPGWNFYRAKANFEGHIDTLILPDQIDGKPIGGLQVSGLSGVDLDTLVIQHDIEDLTGEQLQNSTVKTIDLGLATPKLGYLNEYSNGVEKYLVHPNHSEWKEVNGALFDLSGRSLIVWPINGQAVVLEEGLVEIKPYAFANHTSLTDLDLPESLTVIGTKAFHNTSIISSNIFGNMAYVDNWAVLYVGNGNIVFKEGTIGIASEACLDVKKIYKVDIIDSVKFINSRAFYNSSTTWIKFTNSSQIEVIGDYAFANMGSCIMYNFPPKTISFGLLTMSNGSENCTIMTMDSSLYSEGWFEGSLAIIQQN